MTRNVTDNPDGDERYRLYRLCDCTTCGAMGKLYGIGQPIMRCPDCRGEGRIRELVATATDPESLGVALITLAREGEWSDGCPLGILDTEGKTGQKWLISPWQPSARNISDAGRTLQAARKGKT